ncbi:retrovirus-related pol polyprotein from transposon TNT 1-94 [Tanacetum coccineum]
MTESPLMDSGFVVPVYSTGYDPIACLNKAMDFLTALASSRFPSTNNKLRTSLNLRNQATIQDGRVIVVVKCYNCQGEGHMARQCTQPKQTRNAAWYKEKAMLAEAQEAEQILDEEQLAFLVDPGVPDGQAVQTIIPNTSSFQTEDLDNYDSDYDDLSNAQAVLMANISTIVLTLSQCTAVFNQMDAAVQQFSVDKQCKSCDNQNALEIPELFAYNDLKAQLQDKHSTICFKEQFDSIKKTRGHSKEQSDSLIDKLNLKSAENEDLKAQIQDKVFVITSLKNDLRKIKGKEIVDIASQIPSANTIVPGMFKLDLEPLAPRLLQNREAHIDYLKYTQEQADILQEIVEQAKAEHPLDKELDFACKHAQRIQELLVYVRDTCPNAINLSAKKVAVTPKNKVKKVRFAEPLTSSSNSKQVESSKTSDSNTPVLTSTGLKCSTSKCGSKPTGNKRNDRISQTPSRNMKNKVEAQPRKVNKKNCVVKPVHDVNVKHSLLHANSEPVCATCKKSLFDGVHDICFLDFMKNVNSRAKSAKKHKKENIWRPTGHVFTEVGLKWKPTGRTFTIVGCPVRFGNDHIARIMGYSDYQLGNMTISRVYYVKGLRHNLFFVGQFCDEDLEVAFQKNTCFIRNLEGVNLLSGSRDINLYTISLDDMLKTSPIYLLSKASKTKSWLWHHRLSHLNFGTINKLAKDGLARGIPRLKFQKDHLCSACALGKKKKSSHQPKGKDTNQENLYLLHMDLCGPMRIKDEAPEAIIKCIKNIQVHLNATVRNVRTDNGTEFVNQTLREFNENVGISHQTSVTRTPQQNSVVERRNRTLVEAARTMLIFSKASIIFMGRSNQLQRITPKTVRYNKTPYEPMHDKKPDLSFFHVFDALCYPTNDNDNLGKLDAKATLVIYRCSGPMLHSMTPTTPSSGLVLNPPPLVPFVLPSRKEWDVVFKPMFDEFYSPPASVAYPVPVVEAPPPV